MHRIGNIVATMTLSTLAICAGTAAAADPPAAPSTVQPAAPAADQAKITKSRSNIQNNRQAAPATADSPSTDPKQLVKPKTKSNQSND
ncbi:MAG: hypothetical protein JSR36_16915 [Proteobacteria bacterium]|nr:hypothetical protein [Pseudomonadota bacterium]